MVMNPRRLILLALLCCWPLFASAADGVKPSDAKTRTALHAVISNQLAAFRSENYAAAYGFADDEIKTHLAVEQFEIMVRRGYPLIAHSVNASFGLTFDNGDEAEVIVRVIGGGGQAVQYQYTLRRSGDSWRITGVVPLKELTTEV